jgi:hypothetical protein
MVKKTFGLLIGIIWALSASGQTNGNNEWLLRQRLPDWVNHSINSNYSGTSTKKHRHSGVPATGIYEEKQSKYPESPACKK